MRALSLSQPWAWCVVHGPKRVENRRAPSVASVARSMLGQRLAIHAAKSWDPDASDGMRAAGLVVPMRVALPAGALVGVAILADVFTVGESTRRLKDPEQLRWARGPWCLLLDDVRPLERPVPCRGQLGFWTLTYQEEQAVTAQLEEAAGA